MMPEYFIPLHIYSNNSSKISHKKLKILLNWNWRNLETIPLSTNKKSLLLTLTENQQLCNSISQPQAFQSLVQMVHIIFPTNSLIGFLQKCFTIQTLFRPNIRICWKAHTNHFYERLQLLGRFPFHLHFVFNIFTSIFLPGKHFQCSQWRCLSSFRLQRLEADTWRWNGDLYRPFELWKF